MRRAALFFLSAAVAFAAAGERRKAAPVADKPQVTVDAAPLAPAARGGLVLSYADVVEPAQKAVVSVYSTKIIKERIALHPLFRQFFGDIPEQERRSEQQGMGSGVIVTADGYILTNNHVIEGADKVKVTLTDDRDFIATVVGTDPKTDVAVLKIDGQALPTVTLADSDKLRVGDIVFAVGNPLGVGQTVTMGIVSAKGRSKLGLLENVSGYEDFIQTDAAINMGNSGGALVDARGRLVGINSAIISPSRGNIGIGLAIPVNLARFVMDSLAATGTVARGHLGVTSETLTPDVGEQLGLARTMRGVVITDIDPESAAERAGLRRTDVIVAINGHAVSTWEELRLLTSQIAPDATAALKVMRDGQPLVVEVTLGRVEEKPNELLPGVDVTPLSPDLRRRLGIRDPRINGLVVSSVADDSPYREGLAPNTVILQINRVPVPDVKTAREKLMRGERNLFMILDGRGPRHIVVAVPR
ncbi:MAG: Do family serine endopeptidase [Opitutaceae bacterium]|nr:Do family serine endopeptidase [Opitutaceae bacterium]